MVNWSDILTSALTYLIAVALGAVITAFQQRKRLAEFEREIVKPLRDEVTALKVNYVTRQEFERDMKQLRDDMKEWINLLRSDIKDLGSKLDRRN